MMRIPELCLLAGILVIASNPNQGEEYDGDCVGDGDGGDDDTTAPRLLVATIYSSSLSKCTPTYLSHLRIFGLGYISAYWPAGGQPDSDSIQDPNTYSKS